jgi:chromosome segregation ATPase
MESKMNRSKLLVALIVGTTFSLPASAKLYKWVDDNGITHYGETIPPEYAGKDRSELKAGRVIKTEEILTPEKRRAREQEEAKKREAEKAAAEQQRHDKTLISTYNSAKEIELARGRSLQQIDARVTGTSSLIKTANDNLIALQKEAENLTKAKKKVPLSLEEDLQEAQARLEKLQKDLEKTQAEKAALNARYDADKARYIEMTGKK